jgi:Flp pilus assembly protein TadG
MTAKLRKLRRRNGQSLVETMIAFLVLIPIGLVALDMTVFISSTQQNEQLAETAARSAATTGDEGGARLVAQDAIDHFQTSAVIQSVSLDFVKFDTGTGFVQVGILMDVKLPVPFPGYSVINCRASATQPIVSTRPPD